MLNAAVRGRIQEDRRRGMSIKNLSAKYDLNKSTVHYIVKDIQGREAINRASKREALAAYLNGMTPEQKVDFYAGKAEAAKQLWTIRREHMLVTAQQNVVKACEASGLVYRQDELPIKRAIETLFGKSFNKEKIGGRYVDFADATDIIEVTFDSTKGITDLTARLREVKQLDGRRLTAFIAEKNVGAIRRKRLTDLGVTLRSVTELSPFLLD